MKNEGDFFGNKSGQLTIFIIIAIFVVALSVLVYFLFPQVLVNFGIGVTNPNLFMQSCIEEDVENIADMISLQGGSLSPENYILYQDSKIEYLCYTNEYYKQCVMQQPLLKQHIENEIKTQVGSKINDCYDNLVSSFERRGYGVNLQRGNFDIELLPEKILLVLNSQMTLTKGETQRFERLDIIINNNLYELISIANSILNWEARFGDVETTTYMNYYRDLKVEKIKQTEGSKIYILTDRNTGEKFQFASRSVVFPPGYGIEAVI